MRCVGPDSAHSHGQQRDTRYPERDRCLDSASTPPPVEPARLPLRHAAPDAPVPGVPTWPYGFQYGQRQQPARTPSVAGDAEFAPSGSTRVVLVKLSNAVLPSSAATTAVALGGVRGVQAGQRADQSQLINDASEDRHLGEGAGNRLPTDLLRRSSSGRTRSRPATKITNQASAQSRSTGMVRSQLNQLEPAEAE